MRAGLCGRTRSQRAAPEEGAGEASGSSPPFSLLPRFNASRGLRDGGRLPLPAFWGPLSSGFVSQLGAIDGPCGRSKMRIGSKESRRSNLVPHVPDPWEPTPEVLVIVGTG